METEETARTGKTNRSLVKGFSNATYKSTDIGGRYHLNS